MVYIHMNLVTLNNIRTSFCVSIIIKLRVKPLISQVHTIIPQFKSPTKLKQAKMRTLPGKTQQGYENILMVDKWLWTPYKVSKSVHIQHGDYGVSGPTCVIEWLKKI